jgi:predicted DNA-binding transcriptional regulator AlpA
VSPDPVRAASPHSPGSSENEGGEGLPVPRSPYLLVEDVAARYGVSLRWVHERTRTETIPHRRLPGSRRCLFVEAELEAWENGAALELRELAGGGRVVRPK